MQSASPLQPRSSAARADADGSRQLNDEVLQSAEDAVLVEATAPDVGSYSSAPASPLRSPELHAPATYAAPPLYQKAVAQYVAANPCQSALLAAAVGALAAMLLRSRMRRYAGSRRWTRLR
jgi:hypothetical protein